MMSSGPQTYVARTQPPFHSIQEIRVQDLLACDVVAFAHIDIDWHSPNPNEAENE